MTYNVCMTYGSRKHDVIHKTGSTYCITSLPQENRATAIGNMYKTFGGVETLQFGRYAGGQTNTSRHAHHDTPLFYRGEVIIKFYKCIQLLQAEMKAVSPDLAHPVMPVDTCFLRFCNVVVACK